MGKSPILLACASLMMGCSLASLSEFSSGDPSEDDPAGPESSPNGSVIDGSPELPITPSTPGTPDTPDTGTPDTLDTGTPDPPDPPDPPPDGGTTGPSAACLAAVANARYGFDSDQGWTHAPSDGAEKMTSWPFDPWSRGASTTLACPNGQCWGAELEQNYAQCGRGELLSPRMDLSACAGANVTLVFTHAYAFWSGSVDGATWFDGGIVEISKDNGATWSVPSGSYPGTVSILGDRGPYSCVLPNGFHVHGKSGFTGTRTSPVRFEVTVPATSLTANVRVRFSQAAGVSTAAFGHHREGTAAGWRIDDVHFTAE